MVLLRARIAVANRLTLLLEQYVAALQQHCVAAMLDGWQCTVPQPDLPTPLLLPFLA